MKRPIVRNVVRAALVAALSASALGAVVAQTAVGLEGKGVRVDFIASGSVQDRTEGGTPADVSLGFRLVDENSGEAIPDAAPMAWLLRRSPARTTAAAGTCEKTIKRLLRERASSAAAADLSGFSLAILNEEPSISLLNPAVRVGSANLEAMIPLPGAGVSWAYDARRGRLFVSIPAANAVAVVDLQARRLVATIDTVTAPASLALDAEGRHLWVALEVEKRVAVFDADTRAALSSFPVGSGSIAIAMDDRGQSALLSASQSDALLMVDAGPMTLRRTIAVSPGVTTTTYSALAKAFYAANTANNELLSIDEAQGAVRTHVLRESAVALGRIGASPDGRWVFALAPQAGMVMVTDTATDRVIHRIVTGPTPDHVIFSRDFAYVRNGGSNVVTLIELKGLASDRSPSVTQITIGSGIAPPAAASAAPLAIMPGGQGAMIVNTADATIFHYAEGMMAPMKSLKARGGQPLAVLMHDRRPREERVRGTYEARVRVEPGTYDVPFFVDSPRVVGCFELNVEGTEAAASPLPVPALKQTSFQGRIPAGTRTSLRFELSDRVTGRPLGSVDDLRVQTIGDDGRWQARAWARPLGEGVYEAQFVFPVAGKFRVLVHSKSLGIDVTDRQFHTTVHTEQLPKD